MLSVFAITVPIYACVVVGHVAVRIGVFRREDMAVLSKLVVTFALPCLLFLAVGTRDLAAFFVPTYLAAYAVGLLVTYALGYTYGRWRSGGQSAPSAFDGLGMAAPNSGFVGYPTLLLALPSVAGLVLGLNLLVENLLIIPLALMLAEGAASEASRRRTALAYARRLTRNPLLIGLLAGLLVAALGVPLPAVLTRTADLFAQAGTAVALFAVGGVLQSWPSAATLRRVLVVSLGRLVLSPALVLGALTLLLAVGMPGLDPTLRVAVLLSAAMPVFTILPVLAHPYGESESTSAVLLVTTGLGFVTVSALLVILGP